MAQLCPIKLLRPLATALFRSAAKTIINTSALMLAGLALTLLTPVASSAQGLVNPGFEDSPDLNGWTLSSGGVGNAPTTLGGSVNPTEGSRFGFITTAGTTNTNQFDGTEGTILTQTFTAEEGSTVTLDYNFLTNEPPNGDFTDFARGELVDGNGLVFRIFAVDTNSFFLRGENSGFGNQTGWRTVVGTVPAAGTYTLRFVVSDAVDTDVDSGLTIDNIRVAPRPRLIISEYRLRGPNGASDEFVKLYNAAGVAITVSTIDGSEGWSLVGSEGATRFTIPNGTVIPARGHYLGVNTFGYSLSGYAAGNGTTATGDATYTTDIPDGAGIALFRTADPANFNAISRLDAVGYASSPSLYREGTGFPTGGAEASTNLQYSFIREPSSGLPKDTNNNLADFISVETAGQATGIGQRLGAPGPQNLSSPVNRTDQFTATLIDPAASASASPNRVRDTTPVTNGPQGTLEIRRTFNNFTGSPVTRLRFRIVDMTTFPTPSGVADLRAITSSDINVTRTDGTPVLLRGTTLEEPPAQSSGGGINSTLSAGVVTLATPLAPGAGINIRTLLGVQHSGTFRFFVIVEALP
ncbi:MAG: hypothetical protein WCD76_01670 [Pyrinomonadaceae bacterium]